MLRRARVALIAATFLTLALAGTAGASYDAHTVLVKFRPGVSAANRLAAVQAAGGSALTGSVRALGVSVARVASDPSAVAARLNRSALVQYAEVNQILRVTATPNDPRFSELYGLNNTGQTGGTADADIDAP